MNETDKRKRLILTAASRSHGMGYSGVELLNPQAVKTAINFSLPELATQDTGRALNAGHRCGAGGSRPRKTMMPMRR